jgi:hypothetical protein
MPDEPDSDITPERKLMYYAGMGCTALGVLLFLSVFVTGCANFGNFDNFEGEARSSMARAIGGMVLMMIGSGLMAIGRLGTAGAGVVLDPRKMRKDLEPWNRAAGGMANDALDEIDVVKKLEKKLDEPSALTTATSEPVVKVRCPACKILNDEHAKYCNQCGKAM